MEAKTLVSVVTSPPNPWPQVDVRFTITRRTAEVSQPRCRPPTCTSTPHDHHRIRAEGPRPAPCGRPRAWGLELDLQDGNRNLPIGFRKLWLPRSCGDERGALLRRTLAAPPLVLISVSTFVLSWFVVTFCNEIFCSNLAAMLLAMVF